MLLRRPPQFEKTVLDRGDESARHVGSTGGLQMDAIAAGPVAGGDLPAGERDWLAEHGIGWESTGSSGPSSPAAMGLCFVNN